MKNSLSMLASGVIIFVGLFFLASCGSRQTEETVQENKAVVKTAVVQLKMVEQLVSFAGNVEPFEKAYISSAQPVRINRILKEVGDYVRSGEVLVQMDAANYRQSSVQLANLKKEYARLDTLYKVGSVSEQQLDQLKAQLDVALAANSNLAENTVIRSPISGVVSRRFYEDGEMFAMSPLADGRSAILTVERIDPVKVIVHVGEQYFSMVDKDLKVSLTVDSQPGKVFSGEVHLKYPTIDPNTRTFQLELKFPNKEGLIRPGMFSRVTLGFGSVERVVAPDLAVIRQAGINERYVFVIEDGKTKRKVVQPGRLIGSEFEIISGLKPGEEVVVAGLGGLLDGTEVEISQ